MKIFWVINMTLQDNLDLKSKFTSGGWIIALLKNIIKNDYVDKLTVLYPVFSSKPAFAIKENEKVDFIPYFYNSNKKVEQNTSDFFLKLLIEHEPDIINVWGTESIRTFNFLQSVKEANLIDKTVIKIGRAHV